ncbi:MAG: hypothetical protein RM338_01775 [Nostoc sp. DedQUE12a]|nr:hypothetical protein [Nostoc sp. DedQUE12a]
MRPPCDRLTIGNTERNIIHSHNLSLPAVSTPTLSQGKRLA